MRPLPASHHYQCRCLFTIILTGSTATSNFCTLWFICVRVSRFLQQDFTGLATFLSDLIFFLFFFVYFVSDAKVHRKRNEQRDRQTDRQTDTVGRVCGRQLHGDRYLYPSPTVPVTLIPIPTIIPATSFKIVPIPTHPRIQLSPSPSPSIPISFSVGRFKSMRFKSLILNRDLSQLIFCQ